MGLLVEQSLPTMFGGVSRQPASVRKANQMETHTNALASVVTGGFEKRPPSQTIAWLSFLNPALEYAVHPIDRDSTEQTFIVANNTGIQAVNAITGAEISVTVGDSERAFLIEQADIDSTGVVQISGANMSTQVQATSAETTFDWTFALSDATTVFKVEGSADGSVWNDIATGKTGSSGSFSTTVDAVATGDHNYIRVNITTAAGADTDTITLKATFNDLTYLLGADPEDLRFATVADTTLVINRNVTSRLAEASSGTVTSTVQEFSDLPTPAGDSSIHKVTGKDTDGFGTYFVIDDASSSTYIETVDPNAHNEIDASSMPHVLTRNADGTFTFAAGTWTNRLVGDEEITEAPSFIDKKLQDSTFYRNRLVLVADEECYLGRTGDVFNMWPEKAVEVLDTDPVTRAATTNDINILKFVTVFRKILFATSARAQFEMTSSGPLTPSSAEFDLATTYAASELAKPVALNDVLYFPAKVENHALIYEYFFDETTLSNTAADVSKHIVDYIPNDTLQMAGDPATGTVVVLSTGEQNSLFVYRTFFDGSEKLQSAWGKYTFGASEADAFIHGFAVMSGFIVMMIERDDGEIYLEQIPIERETQDATVGFTPFFDQREVLTGTYNSTYDCTHWVTTAWHDDDAQLVLGPSFSEPGRQPTLVYPDRYLLTLSTVTAGQTVIIDGTTFTAHATTTTVANREFSISGNNTADAGELVTVINDATYGASGITATDNSDGTITLNVDDKCGGSLATPTGTAVSGATVAVAEQKNIVATSGDLSASSVWVGRPYNMSVQLSEIFNRKREGEAVITGRLQLRDITFLLFDTGYLKVTVGLEGRTDREYTFEGKVLGTAQTVIGGASIQSRAAMKVPIWTRSSQATITLSNDQPTPCVVSSAAWRGFFNEISRQE